MIPLLPEDFPEYQPWRNAARKLSRARGTWITGGSFQNQSPQQVAPFFGHDSSDLQEEDSQRGAKENK